MSLKQNCLTGFTISGIIFLLVVAVSFAGTVNYTYDELDQLTKVDYGSGTTIEYTYDNVGNRQKVVTTGAAPSVMSFAINNGASSTTTRTVTLNNTVAGTPTQHMASESSSFSGATWQTYSTTPSFTLSTGNGTKTVHFKVKNAANFESTAVSDSITLNEAPSVTSFAINNGASSTTSQSVTLNNTATGTPTQHLASESSTFSGATWQTYSTTPSFTLGAGNGTKTVYFKVRNAAGTQSASVSDSILLNIVSVGTPTVTYLAINNGATSTTNRVVTLNNTATGTPTQYMASGTSTFSGASWLTYSTAPSYTLSGSSGTKTVYFKVKNASNVQSPAVNDRIYFIDIPVVTSFAVNNGASSTTSQAVTLNNTATGTPTQHLASESSTFSGATWQTYSTTPSFTLSAGNGTKTVYFKVRNAAGTQSASVSDSILLNIVSVGTPTVTYLAINNGATSTTNRVVALNNTATGTPTQYMASGTSTFSGASWLTYSTAPSYTLSGSSGTKTVYFKVRNASNVESPAVNDRIYFIDIPVVTSFAVNNGASSTTSQAVTLNNTATGTPTQHLASESSIFSGAVWQTYSTAPSFTLSSGNGTKTVYFKVRNAAGTQSVSVSDSIRLNIVSVGTPTVTYLAINNGATSTTNRVVTLNNTATGTPTQYMASGTSTFSGASWLAYSTVPSYTLGGSSGTKTVYFKVRNASNVQSPAVNDRIYFIDIPVVTSFAVNNGASSTTSQAVTLNNTATGTPTQHLASESSIFSGAVWQTYSTAPSFTLSSGNGTKTVYFKVRNAAGTQSVSVSDSIRLNIVSVGTPTVTYLAINNGATSTTNRVVTLNNTATGTPTQYMASGTSTFSGASWLTYSTAPSYTLSGSSGTKTVYFKVKNASNVESPAVNDRIYFIDIPVVTSFAINNGASSTTSQSVTLNNTATGTPTQHLASESSTFSGATWQTYSTAPSFTLSSGNGTKTVYFKVRNAAGTQSASVSDSIRLNIVSVGTPTVSYLAINNGATSTTNRVVTLNNTATGTPTQYMASGTSTFSGASWLAYSTAPSYTLSGSSGTKTVYFKVKNASNVESPAVNDRIYFIDIPVVTSFAINNGATSTTSQTVTLNNTATGTPTQHLASESSAFGGAIWQTYSTAPGFTLSSGNGTKTVYFKVRNAAGTQSASVSDSILLNMVSVGTPTVSYFAINNGATSTTNRVVALNNTATGTPTQYMASGTSTFSGASWLTYSTAPSYTLSGSSGTKTVYFKVKNASNVESPAVNDRIYFIDIPVVTSFAVNNGASSTTSQTVTLNNTATGTPTQHLASESSAFGGAVWQTYSTAPSFTLSAGNGTKTVYFKVRNAAGTQSASVSDSIRLN